MRTFNITVNGKAYEVEVEEVGVAAPAPRAAAPKAAPEQHLLFVAQQKLSCQNPPYK